jgi:hypothetical protein
MLRICGLDAEGERVSLSYETVKEAKDGMRRFFTATVLIAVASAVLAMMPAAARAEGATVTSSVTRNVADTIAFTNPCTGESGTVELVSTVIFVLTIRPNGTVSIVAETTGSFTLIPDDPAGQTVTGHFVATDTFGGGVNDVETTVLTAQGTASDGSRYSVQFITHLNETGTGVTFSFQKCA